MIIGDLKNSFRYENLHPLFKEVFSVIKNTNWNEKEVGKIILDDEKLFIIVSEPECIAKEKQVLEYHKKYLDIHILLQGEETIGWKSLNDCNDEKQAYNEKDDYGLYNDAPDTFVTLQPNQFLIVYPEDAHAPIIGNRKIRKLVVKALVDVSK